MDKYINKIVWCPICNQGWVEILKDSETNELFCYCSECESEWDDITNITKNSANSPEKHKQVCEPKESEIIEKNWDKYIIKGV